MEETSLLARCQLGDPTAWVEFVRRYSDAVYRWTLGFGIRPSLAEDITQEVFLTATRKILAIENEEQIATWLFQTTRRHAANARRLAWCKRMVGLEAESSSQEQALRTPHHGFSLSVQQSLQQMPMHLAEVLVLHDFEERTREEIAEMCGIASGTVASRLRQAREHFKRSWNQPLGE